MGELAEVERSSAHNWTFERSRTTGPAAALVGATSRIFSATIWPGSYGVPYTAMILSSW